MYKGIRVCAVVPAHNEAGFIGGVISEMPAVVDEIVVVDDCSDDATSEVAKSVGDPRLRILRNSRNLGLGASMAAGYRMALASNLGVVVKIDGDGQMPPEHLERLLDAVVVEGYDYAKGNRFLAGESLAAMPRSRLIGNIALTFLTKLASGYWHIFDPQNGYTAIRADVLRILDLEGMHRGYFFENDMLVRLNILGRRVKDVSIPARYGNEESGINLAMIGATFPVLLLGRFFKRIYERYILRDFSPIALFLLTGGAIFAWGGAFGLLLWIRTAMTGQATPTGTIMLALLPLVLGFQLLLQGLVLDIQETPK